MAFSLTPEIRVNTKVKVRHLRDRSFGAEFRPPLEGALLERLSRWVFQKREEDVLARGRSVAQREPEPAAGDPGGDLVLVSSSAELAGRLAPLLAEGLPPLRRISPTIQAVRDLGSGRRSLVLFHADSASWETRRRLRTLAEALPPAVPRVVIGTGLDTGVLAELGGDLKAAWTYPLQAVPGSIFPRLLRGIYRKHCAEPS